VSRNLLIAAAVVALVAIVIVVALRSGDQAGTTGASPTPSAAVSASARPSASGAAAATASAAASGSTAAGAVYDDDFGFLVVDPGISGTIRKESSNARIGSAEGNSFVISPDGRQVAYWTVGKDPQLRIFSAVDPSKQQTLVTLTTEHGVGVVWAGDGSGLLYSVATGGGFSNVDSAALRTFDLRGVTSTTILVSTEPGKILQPIAWDRGANVAAAGLTGDGGFMTEYIVVSTATPQAAPKRTPVRRTHADGLGARVR